MIVQPLDAGPPFTALGLAPELLHAVRDAGYTHPTPIQQQAIPLALEGRDLIGLAQTGTGKTAGFTLPIIHNLITTPLTDENGKYTELRVVPIFGGVGIEPQSKALRGGVDVVVATPGRLLDHMERENVAFDDLEVLVLDEAD